MKTTDAIGRRMRRSRQPTGKRIILRPRDLLWFQKLHQHGPLPTSYLLAFAEGMGSDRSRAIKRLADLYNDGRYLTRPQQQFETIDARYNQLVYDLDDRGKSVLKDEGLWSDGAPRPYGPWVHQFMVACITASLELATYAHKNLSYIPQHAILDRAEAGLRAPVPYKNPTTGRNTQGDLIPDAICGIEYRDHTSRRFRFFAVEADRHTEPNRSDTFSRKSYRKSILQYREFIGRGRYKQHFKLNSPLLVLTVTTNERHMYNLIDLVSEIAPSGTNSYFCFQVVPTFTRPFKPPQPHRGLLCGPWLRAGHEPLSIDHCQN